MRGKWALISGGVGAIGYAVAERLAQEHASVILHDHCSDDTLRTAAENLIKAGAGEVHVVNFDLSDFAAVAEGCQRIHSLAHIDILALCAGVQEAAPLERVPRSTWDAILAINLTSAFDLMQSFLPGMAERGYGRVIAIASVHGLVASIEKAPYVAAKHGLVGLMKVVALEYAHVGTPESGGVTVNAICPGWVDTPLIDTQIVRLMENLGCDRRTASTSLVGQKMPTGRFVGQSEIAEVVAMLCSPQMHSFTGVALPLDGGWTAQ